MSVTVTRIDNHISKAEIILEDTIDWNPLVVHLLGDHKVNNWRTIVDSIREFDEGVLHKKDLMVTWHTTSIVTVVDLTQEVKCVKIFRKV